MDLNGDAVVSDTLVAHFHSGLPYDGNFPPHLSCVATLPENTLATEQARCFLLDGWLWRDIGRCDQLTADEIQYSLIFRVLTDVSVAHLYDLNTKSITWSHSAQYAQFMVSAPGRLSTEPMDWSFFSSLQRLHFFQLSTGKFFHKLLCNVSFKHIQTLN